MENVPKCPLNLSTKTNCQYKKKIMFILLNKISLFIQFNLYNMHAYFQAEYAFFPGILCWAVFSFRVDRMCGDSTEYCN